MSSSTENSPVKPMLLRNGRVIDPANGLDSVEEVLIVDGVIKRVTKEIVDFPADCTIYDLEGCWVVPGLIDKYFL